MRNDNLRQSRLTLYVLHRNPIDSRMRNLPMCALRTAPFEHETFSRRQQYRVMGLMEVVLSLLVVELLGGLKIEESWK